MMEKGIIRKKQNPFSQVSNVALRDPQLSLAAKGLYSLIQSFITIPDFTLYKTTLFKQCIEGESAFENRWKELKKAGYLVQHKIRDEKTGKFYYEYELLDDLGSQSTKELKSQDSCHPPKNHPLDIPHLDNPHLDNPPPGSTTPGKLGGYNNTKINNTDLNNIDSNNSQSVSRLKKEDRLTDIHDITAKDFAEKKITPDQDGLLKVKMNAQINLYQGSNKRALEKALDSLWMSERIITNDGRSYNNNEIRSKLLCISIEAMDHALFSMREAGKKSEIKNPHRYLQPTILTAIDEYAAADPEVTKPAEREIII